MHRRPIIGRGKPQSAKPLGIVYVSNKSPFMSVINRTTKLLEKGPGGSKRSTENDRSAVARMDLPNISLPTSKASLSHRREVVLLATGHAIGKLIVLSRWFQRRSDYVVQFRSRWSATTDDLISSTGEEGVDLQKSGNVESGTKKPSIWHDAVNKRRGDTVVLGNGYQDARVRKVNCLEVTVRLS